ncbi:MAG TPA: PEGA domain-containing protein [Polyangiaceae bacterium]|jgi:hypothetical protein
MRRILLVLAVVLLLLASRTARADDPRQASKHFQRGVALYGEADYRSALVEFKRAYALAPNPAVLYNVGETQYQLQDYAGALTTFEHFLAEASTGDAHRGEIESSLEVLRSRVGHLSVTTVPPGADVAVDDQPAGKTPLDRALLVSIGHRKVVATMAGRPAVTRWVDVAADDNVALTLQLPDPPEAAAPAPERLELPAHALDTPPPSHGSSTLRALGWTTTGVLAAGAVTFGVLALKSSHDLEAARSAFPASSETLSHDASLTTTFSVVADALTAGAVVVGGTTLLSTLLSRPSTAPTRGSNPSPQVVLGAASARLVVPF